MITCTKCSTTKDLDQFHNEPRKRNGKQSWCKSCQRQHRKPQGDYHRMRRYGVTPEEVQSMSEAQDGLCAICQDRPWVAVDHCHGTGKVRGLLCHGCNGALGHYEKHEAQMRSYLGRI